MPEILTESFCERCGTRYTFESAVPRAARLKGLKVVSRGLRNFVMSDDTSMDEAMAAARSETDREVTSQQLDAFHKTFNFCMSCRQYTCGNCWNDAEGRCLSCAPHLGHEVMPAPFPDLDPTVAPLGANGNGHDDHAAPALDAGPGPMAWPSSDLMREAAMAPFDAPEAATEPAASESEPTAAASATDAIDATAPGEVEPSVEVAATADRPATWADEPTALQAEEPAATQADEPGATQADEPAAIQANEPGAAQADEPAAIQADEPELEPIDLLGRLGGDATETEPAPAASSDPDADRRAAAAAAQTSDLFGRFRPGQSLDAELDAYERDRAAATGEPSATEPVARASMAVEPEIAEAPATPADVPDEPAVAADSEPAVAAEAEPVALAPEPVAPAPEPAPEPVAAASAPAMPEAAAPEPVVETAPEPAAPAAAASSTTPGPETPAAPRTDVVAQPTWQIVAPDVSTADGVPAPPASPTAPADAPPPAAASAEPSWPSQPEWPSHRPASGLSFLGRPEAPTGGMEALWAESAREVAATPADASKARTGVQPCVSCGLSLSATARFCRRCGSRQG